MFCDYCGEFNEDSNLLCKNCGKSLYESITENNGYYNSLETDYKLPISAGSSKQQDSSRKTSISALLTLPKPLC